MQKFDTPAAISALVDIAAGRVQIIAADRADTTVTVLPANASKGRDVKAAEQTSVEYADGTLRIRTPAEANQVLGASGSVEVTVQLPMRLPRRDEVGRCRVPRRRTARRHHLRGRARHGQDRRGRERARHRPRR